MSHAVIQQLRVAFYRLVSRLIAPSAERIALTYAVFGTVWILLSDRLVLMITTTPAAATQLQTIKGWLFVAIS